MSSFRKQFFYGSLTLLCFFFLCARLCLAREPVADNAPKWFELHVEPDRIAWQKPFAVGCGFACALNALRFGSLSEREVPLFKDKSDEQIIKELMDVYGGKPSQDYKVGKRLRKSGISGADLHEVYNELRQDLGLGQLSGQYLDRERAESSEHFAQRLHQILLNSLKQGEPPIIHIRSQAARWDAKKSEYLWHGLSGHFVAVVGVQQQVNADGSFAIEYIDSGDGKKSEMLIFNDVRNFVAIKGVDLPPDLPPHWLEDRPFLAVSGGSLYLKTANEIWYERTLIYLHYAIYKSSSF